MPLSSTCKSSILKLNFFSLNYEKLCLLKPNHHATKCPLHLMYNSISTTHGKFEIKNLHKICKNIWHMVMAFGRS